MSELILQVRNLSKSYPQFKLNDINLELPRGYIMGFIGQNGAGKTTTIKAILDLIHRDTGEIKLFGQMMKEDEMGIKDKIGFVGENQYFYEEMSVGWTVNFFKNIYSTWNDQYCTELLNKFKISKSKKVKQLSKGMRVKLSFVLALAHQPELLILDEPTSGLDPAARYDVLQGILELIKDENKSVFFSSHITQDIEKVADYITFIDDGKIIFSEEKELVLENYKKVMFTLENAEQIDHISHEFISFRNVGSQCVGIINSLDRLKAYHLRLKGEMEINDVGLEEIFIAYVRGEV